MGTDAAYLMRVKASVQRATMARWIKCLLWYGMASTRYIIVKNMATAMTCTLRMIMVNN